jgi:hypothetical protein
VEYLGHWEFGTLGKLGCWDADVKLVEGWNLPVSTSAFNAPSRFRVTLWKFGVLEIWRLGCSILDNSKGPKDESTWEDFGALGLWRICA